MKDQESGLRVLVGYALTIVGSGIAAYAFARGQDAGHPGWVGTGVACCALLVHRVVRFFQKLDGTVTNMGPW